MVIVKWRITCNALLHFVFLRRVQFLRDRPDPHCIVVAYRCYHCAVFAEGAAIHLSLVAFQWREAHWVCLCDVLKCVCVCVCRFYFIGVRECE